MEGARDGLRSEKIKISFQIVFVHVEHLGARDGLRSKFQWLSVRLPDSGGTPRCKRWAEVEDEEQFKPKWFLGRLYQHA